MKSVSNVSTGDDSVLDNYVNTAIFNFRLLKRVPTDSRVPLAESHLDEMNENFYNEKHFYLMAGFLTSSFFVNNPGEVVVNKRQL